MSNIIYQGRRVPSVIVLVIDEATKKSRTLNPCHSQAISNHSMEFNWGFQGSGPSQLALALLLDAIENTPVDQRPSNEPADALAARWHLAFLNDFVSNWGEDHFRISRNEILGWLRSVIAQAQTRRSTYTQELKFPEPGKTP